MMDIAERLIKAMDSDCETRRSGWIKVFDGSTKKLLEDSLKEIASLQRENAELKKSVFDMYTIVEAAAHIGVDFGYGKYELEPSHIDAARKILEVTQDPTLWMPVPVPGERGEDQ